MKNLQYMLNKNSIFSALLALTVVIILIRVIPPSVDPVLKIVITKNNTGIGNIHQQRDIEATHEVMIDRVNLEEKGRFSHPKLGNIAIYTENFFADIDHTINVKNKGNYRFIIGSDDGFTFKVDGKLLCEFTADRPFGKESCSIFLTEGKHQVQASYFQGYGLSGFTIEYARGDEKPRWFGDNSKDITF